MPTTAEADFYIRREAQERRLADCTPNPEGRRIHLELAERYARLVAEARDAPPAIRIPA
ncbi:hypothetical protein M9979_14585 [Sphingomonas sp. RP10(2022)]|uniref:Uncharacterized protein n=1 Tax=Sphingomonas liriopis TaxID=2949094 RepID=A0A9X2HZ53_9SPHN|nr:hypothetical protein [Sphingomonas liriopis]MCP3736099.1 hypothetical protein [Sphingomonas liriopis]